jgi:hypothetical protein
MATTYSYIYEEFLDKITDPDLLLLAEDDQEAMKRAWLEYAVKKCAMYVQPKFDLSKRTTVEVVDDETPLYDDEEPIVEEVEAFEEDLDDGVIVMLTEYMAEAWLKPYMNNADLLRLHMNTKDFNTTSPANLVEKIGARYDEARRRARSLRNEYTFTINSVTNLSTSKKT